METDFSDWIPSASRYVGFLDIMGFKDFVARNTHADVLKKLNVFSTIRNFQNNPENIRKYGLDSLYLTTFSDSVIIFTKNATEENRKIFMRFLRYILSNALFEGIPIKGACAFGHITVDIINQFFFGQPLIDAYLLQEELHYYGVVAHNTFETKCTNSVFDIETENKEQYLFCMETPFKSGKISHLNIDWFSIGELDELRDDVHNILENLSKGVSGKPRKYIDNTLEVYNKYLEKNGKKE